MSAPPTYNLSSGQTVSITEQGIGAGGTYLFIGGPFPPSPSAVQVYKDNGTGTYEFLQTLTNTHNATDFIINQGCYDSGSGYLVLGAANSAYLYKVVGGLFVLQSVYDPGGSDQLVNGANVQISGTNVVLLGDDFGTGEAVCKYLSVSTGVFVQLQSFNQAVDPHRGNYGIGTASFSGTHLVIGNSATNVLTCFELSGGMFSSVQTINNALLCNVLASGYLFIVQTVTNNVLVMTFSGTWTLSQTIVYPVFSGTLTPAAPYSFVSPTLGTSILLITGSYSGGDNPIVAAYLNGTTWTVYQSGDITGSPGIADQQGLVGADSALFLPNGGTNTVSIFLTSASFTVPGSQLVFYGVRRVRGGRVDPAPSSYKYYEKPYQINLSFVMPSHYDPTQPQFSVFTRYRSTILDFDFELRRITKSSTDANGIALVSPSPFAITLYDSVMVARSNVPVCSEFLIDDVTSLTGRNYWPAPPIMYRVNSSITVDIFTLLDATVALPVNVSLMFLGVRRIPC